MGAHSRPDELPTEVREAAVGSFDTDQYGEQRYTFSDEYEPDVTHYPSGVSYCNDCKHKLILMDDDTHGPLDCEAFIDWRVTLIVEHDPDASINDYDADGKVSHYFRHTDSNRDRPDGFTGRARKIDVDRSGFVWWEPYDDVVGWHDDDGNYHTGKWDQWPMDQGKREYIGRIRDLIESGFRQVGVRIEYTCGCCGTWAEWAPEQWLGGIDVLDTSHIDDLIGLAETITA